MKRFFSILLAAVMLLSIMPVTASATAATSVQIGGVTLNSMYPYYHNGTGGAQGTADSDPTNYNAYFDAANGTLYLNNLNISVGADDAVFYALGNLIINLTGSSTVVNTFSGSSDGIRGVRVDGDLTVRGSGFLTAISGSTNAPGGYCYGVNAYSISVSEGTLVGVAGESSGKAGNSLGVHAREGITISAGILSGKGGTANVSKGVDTYSSITVSGGSLTGTGGTANTSSGVTASSITVSGGKLTGAGGTAESSHGVVGDVTITGGELIASGGTRAINAQPSFSDGTQTNDKWYEWKSNAEMATEPEGDYTNSAADAYEYSGTHKYLHIKLRISTVQIGGKTLSANEPYYHNKSDGGIGTVDSNPTDYNAYLDASSNTLYLNSLNISAEAGHESGVIFANGDLILVLSGSSTVTNTQTTDEDSTFFLFGIRVKGSLTVRGGGSLSATGGTSTGAGGESCGVRVGSDLTVTNGSLVGRGGTASKISRGVYARNITVSGGALTGAGGSAWGSRGVIGSSYTITGGELTASGDEYAISRQPSFSDGTQTNDKWYEWKANTEPEDPGDNYTNNATEAYNYSQDHKYLRIRPATTACVPVTLNLPSTAWSATVTTADALGNKAIYQVAFSGGTAATLNLPLDSLVSRVTVGSEVYINKSAAPFIVTSGTNSFAFLKAAGTAVEVTSDVSKLNCAPAYEGEIVVFYGEHNQWQATYIDSSASSGGGESGESGESGEIGGGTEDSDAISLPLTYNAALGMSWFVMPACSVTVARKDSMAIPRLYTVTIESTENGTITASPSSAYSGNKVTLIVSPASGYTLKDGAPVVTRYNSFTQENVALEVTQVIANRSYSFILSGDATVNAMFVNTDGKGKLTPPQSPVWSGTTATWEPSYLAENYSVQLYKNGEAVGSPVSSLDDAASYDFSSVISESGAGAYTFRVQAKGSAMSVGDPTYAVSDWSTASAAYFYAPLHTHSWVSDWTTNATHHWHECEGERLGICFFTDNSLKSGYGEHVYDSDNDTTCNTCQYTRTITPPASYAISWGSVTDGTVTASYKNGSGEDITVSSGDSVPAGTSVTLNLTPYDNYTFSAGSGSGTSICGSYYSYTQLSGDAGSLISVPITQSIFEFTMPSAAVTVHPEFAQELIPVNNIVAVAGVVLSSGTYYKSNGNTLAVSDSTDWNVRYDSLSATLYLKNLQMTYAATYDFGSGRAALYSNVPNFKIVYTGDNSLKAHGINGEYGGYCTGSVQIIDPIAVVPIGGGEPTGEGTLTFTGADYSRFGTGGTGFSGTITGGTVTAIGGNCYEGGFGGAGFTGTITGGKLNAAGGIGAKINGAALKNVVFSNAAQTNNKWYKWRTSDNGEFTGVYTKSSVTQYSGSDSYVEIAPDDMPAAYTFNKPAAITLNGITATVTYDKSSPQLADTGVTATVTLTGAAVEAGEIITDFYSAKANTQYNVRRTAVTAGQTMTAQNKYTVTFTMPAENVDDLVLTCIFVPEGSRGDVTGDGVCDGIDCAVIELAVSGHYTPTYQERLLMDFDADSDTDSDDLSQAMRISVGL
ncbi:MAG: hypothetical protein GX051_03865 [Clostridiales bacterium]|nr:hypothetical protein [Clostridiales bacterium]